MKKLNIAEAKAQLSKLVNDAARGKTVIIARHGRPVARIVPFDHQPGEIKFGTYRGKMLVPADFDAPDQDIIDMFESSGPLFPERKCRAAPERRRLSELPVQAAADYVEIGPAVSGRE
jgi:prevent-host-death family protein